MCIRDRKYIFRSHQSLSGTVYTRKALQVFRIYKDCLIWTWKHISKLPGESSGMHLSRRTYVPLFSKPLRNIYFSPTSHLLVPSTPEKSYKFFGFTKTAWFEQENTFQNYQANTKATYIIQNKSQTIHYVPFTVFHLVANDIPGTSTIWSKGKWLFSTIHGYPW